MFDDPCEGWIMLVLMVLGVFWGALILEFGLPGLLW